MRERQAGAWNILRVKQWWINEHHISEHHVKWETLLQKIRGWWKKIPSTILWPSHTHAHIHIYYIHIQRKNTLKFLYSLHSFQTILVIIWWVYSRYNRDIIQMPQLWLWGSFVFPLCIYIHTLCVCIHIYTYICIYINYRGYLKAGCSSQIINHQWQIQETIPYKKSSTGNQWAFRNYLQKLWMTKS